MFEVDRNCPKGEKSKLKWRLEIKLPVARKSGLKMRIMSKQSEMLNRKSG